MSFSVNTEPGGIIWQARRHMAASPDTQPLNKDAAGFVGYAADMTQFRKKRDNMTGDQANEFFDNLAAESMDYPFGRQLTKQQELPNGKLLTVHLTLLGESIGIMPDYKTTEPSVKKIGRVTLFLQNLDRHPHMADYKSSLKSGMDILTNGAIHMSSATLDTCISCPFADLGDETDILDRLGMKELHADPKRNLVLHQLGIRSRVLSDQRFDNDQTAALQSFLAEQFPFEQAT